jgi:LysR family glycine cleavage system transcriptional activator
MLARTKGGVVGAEMRAPSLVLPPGGARAAGAEPVPSLENLRCFEAAARAPTFRAAARAVALTPAALGQRIRQLEDQLGIRLFERSSRSVQLTAAGRALLPAVRTTMDAALWCVRTARGEAEPRRIELVVGTRLELGLSFLLPSHEAVTSACPGLNLHYFFGSGPELLGRVRTRELDCAVTSARFTDPELHALPLHREDYVFVGAARLLRRSPLARYEQAAGHTLLDVDPSLPLFRYWHDAAGGQRVIKFQRTWFLGAGAAIHRMVLEEKGVAVLPLYMVRDDLERGTLREVLPSVKPHFDHFRLILRGDDSRRPVFERLAQALLALPLR